MDTGFHEVAEVNIIITKKLYKSTIEDFALLGKKNKECNLLTNENILYIGDTQSPRGFLSVIKTLDQKPMGLIQ